jgi:uroporphyrinogen III methyltransferase/synthase
VTVYLVGAGPGDPGLITRRGAEVLAAADVVLYDRLVDVRLLDLVPPGAVLVDVGKRPGAPRRQDEVNALLLEYAAGHDTVVRLKGGDPFVFGRGGEEAAALVEAGVPFEVVPGVSSAFAVPASAGIPVTQRGVSSSVTVVTGHVGEPGEPGAVDWDGLARAGGTLVVLMGMATRAEIVRRLVAGGRAPDTPVTVVHAGTTPKSEQVRTTLERLVEVALDPPCVIVIGPVAALDLRPPPDDAGRPLAGKRVVVTRPKERAASLVAALERVGASVLELPVIAVVDPPDGGAALRAEAARASSYDWIVFTSAHAAARFSDALRDGRALGTARLAAVGVATADALASRHLAVDLVPVEHSAAGLVEAMAPPSQTEGGRVLFPRALRARDVLAPGLRAKGWDVIEVDAYETVGAATLDPAALDPAVLDAAAGADVVVFASPSSVTNYAALMSGRPLPATVACIGPVTAEEARHAGFDVSVVAQEPGAAGLVHALCAHVVDDGGGPRVNEKSREN